MKLNCTTGPLLLWSPVNQNLFTTADLRQVFDEQRQVFVALFVSAVLQADSRVELIPARERDANANLFIHAAEMLQLLIDQQAMRDRLATMTYDEAVAASLELNSLAEALLAKLRELGVVE